MDKKQKISIVVAIIGILIAIGVSVYLVVSSGTPEGNIIYNVTLENASGTEFQGYTVDFGTDDEILGSFYVGYTNGNVKNGDVTPFPFYDTDFAGLEISEFFFEVSVSISDEEEIAVPCRFDISLPDEETLELVLTKEGEEYNLSAK